MTSLSEQVKAIKQQAAAEKQLKASAEQQYARRTDEVNSLHARMQQTHEQHNAEVSVTDSDRIAVFLRL